MYNIFLFNYLAGQCGDFLCQQISQDENYYNLKLISPGRDDNNNQWVNDNLFYKYQLNFKNIFGPQTQYNISEDVKQQIDQEYSQKNLIVPSHRYAPNHLPVNLPRIRYVQTYCSEDMLKFYYTLLCIKVTSLKFNLNGDQPNLKRLKQQLSFQYKQKYANDTEMLAIIDAILEKGYIYQFEKFAIMEGMTTSNDAIVKLYGIYQNLNVKSNHADVLDVDVDAMILNPKGTAIIWQDYFNMSKLIDTNTVEQYHQTNLNLIESKFNKSWSSFSRDTWQDELSAWVKSTCPGSY